MIIRIVCVISCLLYASLCFGISAQLALSSEKKTDSRQSADPAKNPLPIAIAIKTAPVFAEPAQTPFPKTYISKNDTCRVDSVTVDSAEVPWMRVKTASASGWTPAKNLRYVQAGGGKDSLELDTVSEADKKRRSDFVKTHSALPLRVKRAIHAGQICLDMSEDQLRASWGEPFLVKKAFMLGVGEHSVLFYYGAGKQMVYVTVSGGKVVGWLE